MEIRESINSWLPLLIPEVSDRLYFGYVPEDCDLPAMAYMLDNENYQRDLAGEIFSGTAMVRFGIVAETLEEVDDIKCKVLELCGVGKLPNVQLIEYSDGGDSDSGLDIENHLVGAEVALTFYL